MEHDLTGLNNAADIPGKAADMPNNLPNDRDERGSAEFAADLGREEETEPAPREAATLNQGEDAVLFVEAIDGPEVVEVMIPLEDMFMGADSTQNEQLDTAFVGADLADTDTSSVLGIDLGPDLEQGIPWYQSRWMYLGAGLLVAAAATLGIGGYVFVRNRNRRSRSQDVTRRVANTLGRARLQTSALTPGRLSQWTTQISDQAGKLGSKAQSQLSHFTSSTQGAANLKSLQQLTTLPVQAREQWRSLEAATKATMTGSIGKAQESLSHMRENMATSTTIAKSGIKHGWKLGRNITLGATAGMLWSYFYAPQDGETTRQHLKQMLPPQLKNE